MWWYNSLQSRITTIATDFHCGRWFKSIICTEVNRPRIFSCSGLTRYRKCPWHPLLARRQNLGSHNVHANSKNKSSKNPSFWLGLLSRMRDRLMDVANDKYSLQYVISLYHESDSCKITWWAFDHSFCLCISESDVYSAKLYLFLQPEPWNT